MNGYRSSALLRGIAVVSCACLPVLAMAQPWPSKPLTIVVPYPPGASTDQVARLVQPKLAASLGQSVVIDYKPGANGNIGAAYVAKSPPDGYRMLMATQPIVTINPYFYKDMGFDPQKELTPLTNAVNAVVAIGVHPSLPATSIAELVAYAKKNPAALSYGTAGTGSPQHIGGLLLNQRAQIDIAHVPYKGGGPMVSDLLAGHIKVGIVTYSALKSFVADGRVRVIGIGEKSRFAGAPSVPTIAETIPGFELTTWLAFFGPGGLPADLANRLSAELVKALQADDVRQRLQEAALPVNAEGPDHLARLVRSDLEVYGRIIRENRLSAD